MGKSLSNGSFCCCAMPIRGWQIVFEIFFLGFLGGMWDIRDIIYGFFMSGDNPFSLSAAIALCAAGQPLLPSCSLGEAILGSEEEPGILENIWNALIEGVKASGSSFQSATQTAGAAMQSASSSVMDMLNRSNLLMRNRMVLQGA